MRNRAILLSLFLGGRILYAACGEAAIISGPLEQSAGVYSNTPAGSTLLIEAPADQNARLILRDGASTSGIGELRVGELQHGALEIRAAGELTNTHAYLGHGIDALGLDARGEALVRGTGARWESTAALTVGHFGSGLLTIADGGRVDAIDGYIGRVATGRGEVQVTGDGAIWDVLRTLRVGNGGSGLLKISGGGKVRSNLANLSEFVNSSGTVLVTGTGSTWEIRNDLLVARRTYGKLELAEGGVVTNEVGRIGEKKGALGEAFVTGTGSRWLNSQELFVGDEGNGRLTIAAGGEVRNTAARLGKDDEGVGAVLVTGQQSRWINAGDLYVGQDGGGTLEIRDGGTVTNQAGYLGYSTNSTGEAILDGQASRWENAGDLYVGRLGDGKLTVGGGAYLTNQNGYLGFGNNSGQAAVRGAGSHWENVQNLYLGGTASEVRGQATLTIEQGGRLTVGGLLKLWDDAELHLEEGGTLSVGATDLADGAFHFDGGTLNVNGQFSLPVAVPSGGMIAGNGRYTHLAVAAGGTVSPGNSTGTLASDFTEWQSGGRYLWELGAVNLSDPLAGTAGIDWDLWNTGQLTITAAAAQPFVVAVDAVDGRPLADWDPSLAYTWTIATADAGRFGSTVLDALMVDPTAFAAVNDPAGGTFGLAGSPDGTELRLTFAPGVANMVPEPGAFGLAIAGLVVGVMVLLKGRRARLKNRSTISVGFSRLTLRSPVGKMSKDGLRSPAEAGL